MNETDRELLMWAAKAAGIEIYESTDGTIQNRPVWVFEAGGGMGTMPYEEEWNPLRDDGPAFRLKVKLQIDIMYTNIFSPRVHAMADYDVEITEEIKDDPYTATRRAIVRAAAEIGRNMK